MKTFFRVSLHLTPGVVSIFIAVGNFFSLAVSQKFDSLRATNMSNKQCDQICRFLKGLCDKFSYKRAQMFANFLKLF